jgi:glycosyltransferase involved in cell wall biosynthesis
LAESFGFTGRALPLIPNTGGMPQDFLQSDITPISLKKLIYIKGYGGKFGLGAIAIEVGRKLLENFPKLELVIVSVTPDLESNARNLKNSFPGRVNFWTVRSSLNHKEIFELLKSSIIYIGCSKSDGISTTFLESLAAGAYPIQTNTSCANEWIEMGFEAHLSEPKFSNVYDAAEEALLNLDITDQKINHNKMLSKKYLSPGRIKELALDFYD